MHTAKDNSAIDLWRYDLRYRNNDLMIPTPEQVNDK